MAWYKAIRSYDLISDKTTILDIVPNRDTMERHYSPSMPSFSKCPLDNARDLVRKGVKNVCVICCTTVYLNLTGFNLNSCTSPIHFQCLPKKRKPYLDYVCPVCWSIMTNEYGGFCSFCQVIRSENKLFWTSWWNAFMVRWLQDWEPLEKVHYIFKEFWVILFCIKLMIRKYLSLLFVA